MPIVNRRTLLEGAAAALAGGYLLRSAAAATPEFSFKVANTLSATHPTNIRLNEAAQKILDESGGKLSLQIFPSGALGGESDIISQVRSGAIEFMMNGALVLSSLVPVGAITGMGFVFKDYTEVWPAVDGDLGSYIRGALSKIGLLPMDKVWDLGFRQVTNSVKPVEIPADLKGLKIRVPGSPAYTSLFQALGASPVTLPFPDVYAALQTKVADGQENPLAVVLTSKIYEVQRYCSLTNHVWDGLWLLANKRAWDQLPPDLQAIAAKHLNAGALAQRDDVAKMDEPVLQEFNAKGIAVNRTDPAPFRRTLQDAGFYKNWRDKFGEEAWAKLEKAVGRSI
jgi:TRAP-type transport system periplasmic protein